MKKNYLPFGKIISINTQEEEFTIILEKQIVCVTAYADCCSESWFDYPYDFEGLIGKRLFRIENTETEIDLPLSNRQECDQNIISYIYTEKEEPTMFYLRNSSNGYYGGWFEIKSQDYFCPIIPNNIHKIGDKLSDVSICFDI